MKLSRLCRSSFCTISVPILYHFCTISVDLLHSKMKLETELPNQSLSVVLKWTFQTSIKINIFRILDNRLHCTLTSSRQILSEHQSQISQFLLLRSYSCFLFSLEMVGSVLCQLGRILKHCFFHSSKHFLVPLKSISEKRDHFLQLLWKFKIAYYTKSMVDITLKSNRLFRKFQSSLSISSTFFKHSEPPSLSFQFWFVSNP